MSCCAFKQSLVNINLTNFELVRLVGLDDTDGLANVLDCKRVELLIKYMGLPSGANHKDRRCGTVS